MANTILVQTNAVTQKAPSGAEIVDGDGVIMNPAEGIHETFFSAALKGSYPATAFVAGMDDEIVAGLNATDAVERAVGNNHLGIDVTVLVGSDTVVVTGDSVDEADGSITLGDTENITVDAVALYQTAKKWLRVTGVTIPGGITGITYALDRLGYHDYNNNDFTITGYRLEMVPTNAATVTVQIIIYKVQDEGSGKYTMVTVEDITYKGVSPYIVDTKRGTRGYNAAAATIHKAGIPSVLKMGDFETFFSSDENIFESSTKNEGYIIKVIWANTDYVNYYLRWKAGTG